MGLLANFMVYLLTQLQMDQVAATNLINVWSGASNFAPMVGAFISDAYLGRFWTIAFSSIASFLVRPVLLHYLSYVSSVFFCNSNGEEGMIMEWRIVIWARDFPGFVVLTTQTVGHALHDNISVPFGFRSPIPWLG